MELSRILLEKKDGVATIILNRPDKLNAIDQEMLIELQTALADVDHEESIRVVVITGAGKAFSAGADLKSTASFLHDPLKTEEWFRLLHQTYNAIENFTKPVIAAVNGMALAGGLELVEACDLVIAAEDARLGDQHANFGLVPGGGGTQRLPRLIGIRRAKELLLTGRWLSAIEAKEMGLVNWVAPSGKLGDVVKEITDDLVKNKSSMASRQIKRLVNSGIQGDLGTGLELEIQGVLRHCDTEDFAEGIDAFKDKRRPIFKGK